MSPGINTTALALASALSPSNLLTIVGVDAVVADVALTGVRFALNESELVRVAEEITKAATAAVGVRSTALAVISSPIIIGPSLPPPSSPLPLAPPGPPPSWGPSMPQPSILPPLVPSGGSIDNLEGSTDKSSPSLDAGATAGLAVGSAVAAGILIFSLMCCVSWRKQSNDRRQRFAKTKNDTDDHRMPSVRVPGGEDLSIASDAGDEYPAVRDGPSLHVAVLVSPDDETYERRTVQDDISERVWLSTPSGVSTPVGLEQIEADVSQDAQTTQDEALTLVSKHHPAPTPDTALQSPRTSAWMAGLETPSLADSSADSSADHDATPPSAAALLAPEYAANYGANPLVTALLEAAAQEEAAA